MLLRASERAFVARLSHGAGMLRPMSRRAAR